MGRQPCYDKLMVKKGPWTVEEDKKLINFILTNGHCCWRALPKRAGLRRCGKSCRLRWTNYVRPDLKRGILSDAEEQLVIQLHALLGNRLSKIAARLPGRTYNEIKNHWNTHIKKKLLKMEIDPLTHQPLNKISTDQTFINKSETPSKAGNVQRSDDDKNIEITNTIDESSTISNQNSSTDRYYHLWTKTNDKPPLVDASWSNNNDVGIGKTDAATVSRQDFSTWPSEDKNVKIGFSLDYFEDFGVEDLRFEDYHGFGQSSMETNHKDE